MIKDLLQHQDESCIKLDLPYNLNALLVKEQVFSSWESEVVSLNYWAFSSLDLNPLILQIFKGNLLSWTQGRDSDLNL